MANGMITVQLCAPEQASLELNVREVAIPGEAGIFTVLPGHTPFLTTLLPGVIVAYEQEDDPSFYAVSGGFAEVKDDTVKILADAFNAGQEIDLERARAARERAEERLKRPSENLSLSRAELALQRAIARIGAHDSEGY